MAVEVHSFVNDLRDNERNVSGRSRGMKVDVYRQEREVGRSTPGDEVVSDVVTGLGTDPVLSLIGRLNFDQIVNRKTPATPFANRTSWTAKTMNILHFRVIIHILSYRLRKYENGPEE
jgi:hypothetical protein